MSERANEPGHSSSGAAKTAYRRTSHLLLIYFQSSSHLASPVEHLVQGGNSALFGNLRLYIHIHIYFCDVSDFAMYLKKKNREEKKQMTINEGLPREIMSLATKAYVMALFSIVIVPCMTRSVWIALNAI